MTHFERIDPILRVADIPRSLRFYTELLDFTVAPWGSDSFTCVSRDGCDIYLCANDQGAPGTWVWVGIDDARALHDLLVARGVTIRSPLINHPWALEFQIEDPDRHVLRFGSDPLPGTSSSPDSSASST